MNWRWSKFFGSYLQVTNCMAHMFAGFWLSYLMYRLTGWDYSCAAGLCVGFIMEVKQYFFDDKRDLKIEDRVADLSQWLVGSLMLYLLWL